MDVDVEADGDVYVHTGLHPNGVPSTPKGPSPKDAEPRTPGRGATPNPHERPL